MSQGENTTEQMDHMLDTMTQKNQQSEESESQFQKLGDVVENEDDNGVVQIESLCMNCHENVSCSADLSTANVTNLDRAQLGSYSFACPFSETSSSKASNARIVIFATIL
jgi:predicted aldo/keto reductase-like oxidoreductase